MEEQKGRDGAATWQGTRTAQDRSCSFGRKCVCYNSHFWGKKNISFWSAQSLQAEYGFPLMHADFLIYDDCGSVVFLTCHDTTFLFILVYDRSQEFP